MNECYFFQSSEQPQGCKYELCGCTVKKIILNKDSANYAFDATNRDCFTLSDNGTLLDDFDVAIKDELEEYDIPCKPEALAWAKYLLIGYFDTVDYHQCVANGFTPKIELNALGYVKIVWYTKEKNISLTFKDDEVLFLIDDEDNVAVDTSDIAGLKRQFQRVEKILKKYA